MAKSKIEWTEDTWNPMTGCSHASTGCAHCYAETMARRLKGMGKKGYENGFEVALHPDRLDQPYRWKRPRKVFVCSMGDLFHEDVPLEYINRVFKAIADNPQHIFQVLTKRPLRAIEFFDAANETSVLFPDEPTYRFLPNLWFGVTAENQRWANRRIPQLCCIPATVRFVSVEPMLGPVDMTEALYGKNPPGMNAFGLTDGFGYEAFIHWVICGGESGISARPMDPDWATDLMVQCRNAEVPFFFKQMGSAWARLGNMTGKGNDPAHWPKEMRIQQLPTGRPAALDRIQGELCFTKAQNGMLMESLEVQFDEQRELEERIKKLDPGDR